MISPVSPGAGQAAWLRPAPTPALRPGELGGLPGATGPSAPSQGGDAFGNVLGRMIEKVDATGVEAGEIGRQIMLGQSDQLHRGVIALQEASLSLTLMVEVRNKLVESYQELMRMPV